MFLDQNLFDLASGDPVGHHFFLLGTTLHSKGKLQFGCEVRLIHHKVGQTSSIKRQKVQMVYPRDNRMRWYLIWGRLLGHHFVE